MALIVDLVLQGLQMAAVLLLAPLLTGFVRKAKAFLLRRQGHAWSIELSDAHDPRQTARVEAKAVVNAAGIWIDGVNRLAEPSAVAV